MAVPIEYAEASEEIQNSFIKWQENGIRFSYHPEKQYDIRGRSFDEYRTFYVRINGFFIGKLSMQILLANCRIILEYHERYGSSYYGDSTVPVFTRNMMVAGRLDRSIKRQLKSFKARIRKRYMEKNLFHTYVLVMDGHEFDKPHKWF